MKSFYVFLVVNVISISLLAQPVSKLEMLFEQSKIYNYSNKSFEFRTLAAGDQPSIIRDQFKPKIEAAYQINYATYNNISGMFFPPYITGLSGPQTINNIYDGVFGSAAALIAKWDVATFGYQKSLLKQAHTQVDLLKAQDQLHQFRENVQISGLYLDWLLAHKLISVYKNNMERSATLLDQSKALARNGLKPAADSSSLSSEFSKSMVLLEQQQRLASTTFIQLQQLIGTDIVFTPSDTLMLNKLPAIFQVSDSILHPELSVIQKEMAGKEQEVSVMKYSNEPKITLYGTGYARGSGVDRLGNEKAFEGLYFQRYNYAVGAQLAVPLFEGSQTKMKVARQQQLLNASSEDYKSLQWQLLKDVQLADTVLQRSIQIVSITSSQQRSALFLFNAVSAKYKAGLVSYIDVGRAQTQLLQAEVDVQKSTWDVWKAVLYKATVLGDLNFFTRQFK